MCRAVWVMIVGQTADENKALRRAAGADAQVVAMATSSDEALGLIESTPADVVVIGAGATGARDLVATLSGQTAVVWVGSDPPEGAHASIPAVTDALEGAITKGLLAARAAR